MKPAQLIISFQAKVEVSLWCRTRDFDIRTRELAVLVEVLDFGGVS